MIQRGNLYRAAALTLLALLLAACSGAKPAGLPAANGLPPGAPAATVPERKKLTIGVGGQELFIYLPATLARQLGYFEQAGLDVEIVNFQGGGKALEALVGGGIDAVVGFYDHTIQAQPKGIALTMVVVYDRYPGIVLLADPEASPPVRDFADLRGQTVGITSFGSSTHFTLNYLLARAGILQDEVSIVQIGTGSASVAAMENGKVTVGLFLDPAATRLLEAGKARVIWDTRSEHDTVAAFGGPYPAGGMYTTRERLEQMPNAIQAAVAASLRTLDWIQDHSAADVADRMPPDFYGGDKRLYVDSLAASLALFSPDGLMPESGPASVLNVLKLSDPVVREAPAIDLAATYSNRFVEAVRQTAR
ncbi:MAG TPA: ABC transporter substrate-binding protein [Chloroflexota bacterium]|nr:ABC transporter substrate-binding protein [Chloroflexota bacterium]